MSDLELLKKTLPDTVIETNYALGAKSTYGVGGHADVYVCLNSRDTVIKFSQLAYQLKAPILILGAGSNMLVADSGFPGIVISLGSTFSKIQIKDTQVQVEGMATLPSIARQAAGSGLGGFEWAVGVPGSVGGAIRMNAGAHGSDISKHLNSVDVVSLKSGELQTLTPAELNFSYRSSSISTEHLLVISAQLTLSPTEPNLAKQTVSEIVKWRKKNQPSGRNAGSVFKNPVDISAGQLLDKAGAKELSIGSAKVSTKHANFISIKSKGKAQDVFNLMENMQELVWEHSGVLLKPETILVNFPPLRE